MTQARTRDCFRRHSRTQKNTRRLSARSRRSCARLCLRGQLRVCDSRMQRWFGAVRNLSRFFHLCFDVVHTRLQAVVGESFSLVFANSTKNFKIRFFIHCVKNFLALFMARPGPLRKVANPVTTHRWVDVFERGEIHSVLARASALVYKKGNFPRKVGLVQVLNYSSRRSCVIALINSTIIRTCDGSNSLICSQIGLMCGITSGHSVLTRA